MTNDFNGFETIKDLPTGDFRVRIETVTIPEENRTASDKSTNQDVLVKDLKCTCGWEHSCVVWHVEAMVKHHLLYAHGHGRYIYAGSEYTVEHNKEKR